MLIEIENPEYADAVRVHFTRSGFRVRLVSDGVIDVRLDDAPNANQERLEVDLHLRVWEAMNPGKAVNLLR